MMPEEKRRFNRIFFDVPVAIKVGGTTYTVHEVNNLSAHIDVLPTLCEVSGASVPEDTDGQSFLPTLLGQEDQPTHDYLYWEFPSYGGQQAVRLGNWKGVRTGMAKGNRKIQLYDLATDIGEQRDVAADHPDLVKRIEKIMTTGRTPAAFDVWNRFLAKPAKKKQARKG